jgi:hypothetical protein
MVLRDQRSRHVPAAGVCCKSLIQSKAMGAFMALVEDQQFPHAAHQEVPMFVVRLKRPGEDPDLRAFGSRRAAVARLRAAQRELIDGEVEDCALLEIDTLDAAHALELAAQRQGRVIEVNLQDSNPRDSYLQDSAPQGGPKPQPDSSRSPPATGSPTS